MLLALGDHAGAVLENHQLHGRLRSAYLAIVRMLADAIEAKDPFVRARSDELSACVEAVARRLELDDTARERLCSPASCGTSASSASATGFFSRRVRSARTSVRSSSCTR